MHHGSRHKTPSSLYADNVGMMLFLHGLSDIKPGYIVRVPPSGIYVLTRCGLSDFPSLS